MNGYKAIATQLRRNHLTQTAAKGEVLGLIAADYYLAIGRLFKSIGKQFSALKHPNTASLPTVVMPHRWL